MRLVLFWKQRDLKIIIIFLLLLLVSCQGQETDYNSIRSFGLSDFPLSKNLTGTKLGLKGIINPENLLWSENHLIVEEKGVDTLFKVFSRDHGFKLTSSFGIVGNGPGEITAPRSIFNSYEPYFFWAWSGTMHSMYLFDIRQQSALSKETRSYASSEFLANRVIQISDSIIFCTTYDGNDKFLEFDMNAKPVKKYGTWDQMLRQDIPPNVIQTLHQGDLLTSPDRSKVVMACKMVNRIEIVNRNTGNIISLRGPGEELIPDFEVDNSAGYPMLFVKDRFKTIYHYLDLACGEELFYTLYSGENGTSLVKEGNYPKIIYAFDYSGNLKARYILDRPISAFTIDEKNRKLYGISVEENTGVVEFDY